MRLIILPLVAACLVSAPAIAAPKGCPPGLANKSPACVPPGLAKKGSNATHRYRVGDRISGDYILIENPDRYGLRRGTYYRVGDYVYRVDRETREVLDLIGAVAALLD